MASTNKTPFLGLNQWLGTDKPKRDDFNRDNLATETKVRAHCEDAVAHVSAQERAAWNKSVYTVGSYAGTGATPTRNIDLGYQPRMVFIYAVGKPFSEYRAAYDSNNIYAGFYTPSGATFGLEVTPMGFLVRQNSATVMSGNTLALNQAGVTYVYVVFR